MPYLRSPPRLKRVPMRRTTYLRRYKQATRMSKILRNIGAPALAHTFAKPGRRIVVHGAAVGGGIGVSPVGSINIGSLTAGSLVNCVDLSFSQVFKFNEVNGYSDLQNMYDNFRIKMIKLRIDLSYDTVGNVAPMPPGIVPAGYNFSNNAMPMLHYAVDVDDSGVPASVDAVLDYSKSRSVRLGSQPVYINFVPRCQSAIATSGGTGTTSTVALGGMLPANTWLDAQGAADTPHFGIKYYIENAPNCSLVGTQTSWQITFTPVYILEMKNTN